jgi:hypothetical protein
MDGTAAAAGGQAAGEAPRLPPPPQPAPRTRRAWLEELTRAFEHAGRPSEGGSSDGTPDVGAFVGATAEGVREAYSLLFSRGPLAHAVGILQRDLDHHVAGVRGAAARARAVSFPPSPSPSLAALLDGALLAHGGDAEAVRRDAASAVWNVLWLTRIYGFLATFSANLAGDCPQGGGAAGAPPAPHVSAAARAAYDAHIRPYHGFIVASFASLLLRATPDLAALLAELGDGDGTHHAAAGAAMGAPMPQEEAAAALRRLAAAVYPVAEAARAALVSRGLWFADKAGAWR